MMSWDDTLHNDQNDHSEAVMPLYAGLEVIGDAGNFSLADGRHNALRWHEFSRTDALPAEPLTEYGPGPDDDVDEDELRERATDDTAAQLTQGASAGA